MRNGLTTLAVSAALVALALPAGAATSATISGTSRTGNTLTVTGTSSYDDQTFVEMGTDPADDATTPSPAGQDMTAAAIRAKSNGELEFRWTVSNLPPATSGFPTSFYGWTFCVDEESCFELDAGRFYDSPTQAAPSGALWACGDSSCAIPGQTFTGTPVAVTIQGEVGAPGIVIARIPSTVIEGGPGSVITPVLLSANGSAFAAIYDSYVTFNVFPNIGDGVMIETDYEVPRKEVSLAIGASGQDPASLTYATQATVAGNGSFTGGLDVAGLAAGSYTVYARACFGAGNCAYGTLDVTI